MLCFGLGPSVFVAQQESSPLSLSKRLLCVWLGLALFFSGLISLDAELHRDTHGGKDCKSVQCAANLFASGAVSPASENPRYSPPIPNFQGLLPVANEILLPTGATKIRAARDPPAFPLQAV